MRLTSLRMKSCQLLPDVKALTLKILILLETVMNYIRNKYICHRLLKTLLFYPVKSQVHELLDFWHMWPSAECS